MAKKVKGSARTAQKRQASRASGHWCSQCFEDIIEKDLVVVKALSHTALWPNQTLYYHRDHYDPGVPPGPGGRDNHPETKMKQVARKPEFGGWATKEDSKKRGYDRAYSAFSA